MVKNLRLDIVFILLALLSWIFLTTYTLQVSLNSNAYDLENVFPLGKMLVKNLFLISFFLFVFLLFRRIYTKTIYESLDKSTWPADFVNASCLGLHVIILVFEHLITPPIDFKLWLNIINNFNILVETVFCANCFYYFKNLILHRKTKKLENTWNVYEVMIYTSIALSFLNVNIDQLFTIIGLCIFGAVALYLSTQMKWVAYQGRKDKIKYILRFSIFLVTLTLVLQNIFFESLRYGDSASHLLVIDSAHKFFVLAASAFVMFYCISSTLILLFNLPTSSVFEEKMLETYNFKQLTKIPGDKETTGELFKLLLNSCLSTTRSTSGWIEWISKEQKEPVSHKISPELLKKLTLVLENISSKTELSLPKTSDLGGIFDDLNARSIVVKPIIVNEKIIAKIGLIKDVAYGFDLDTHEILDSYIQQTSTTLENRVYLNKALENERYREEQKIAHAVKLKLLDKELVLKDKIEYSIYFESTDMVGGDFFDSFEFRDGTFLVALGDVSGHGTSAAFNMSQLNGIFHSVVNFNSDRDGIPAEMNRVLNKCLAKNSFVSLSFFFIDPKKQIITHSRCGHNPAIFKQEDKAVILNPAGIGLGILEMEQFKTITESIKVEYKKGDELICYTDGVTETVNEQMEQYSEENLIELVANLDSRETTDNQLNTIRKSVNDFRNNAKPKDDSTCLIIKF